MSNFRAEGCSGTGTRPSSSRDSEREYRRLTGPGGPATPQGTSRIAAVPSRCGLRTPAPTRSADPIGTARDLRETAESLYRSTEQTPISERARRNKLANLEAYDLIEVLGENRHREYQVRDSAVSSKLDIEAAVQ